MARPKSPLSKFIESLAFDLPVKDVVRRAKERGFTTSESNVVRVRALARKTARQGLTPKAPAAVTTKPAPPAAKSPTRPPSAPAGVTPENELRRAILEVGIHRTEAIIAELHVTLARLFA